MGAGEIQLGCSMVPSWEGQGGDVVGGMGVLLSA